MDHMKHMEQKLVAKTSELLFYRGYEMISNKKMNLLK
jgi:hypothetical protein